MRIKTCDGITCKQYKATRKADMSYYDLEGIVKRCNYCVIFIQYEGLNCPCCNSRLAMKPRNKKKWRLRDAIIPKTA